ncbi:MULTISPECIES: hypothetical protein [unclassified Shinella]|uniref:hypothetical protein n=1 Tax=unclassified Shinella TaxID=2643062 RepID=UPI00234FACC5|nr:MULTISPECIES: hypothetical protein [unclassified Shinella]MCO5152586.1 hypothetical protein [Shinella sp.]MDC7261881.1 hypothetical protein [Shinella sp. HY16]MDC7268776.1 hypothetical protein [Shinella sp. YZ44]
MSKSVIIVLAALNILVGIAYASRESRAPEIVAAPDALEHLLPSSNFSLGMSVQELEEVLAAHYPDWVRSERMRAVNNRKDVSLAPAARSSYLQTIYIYLEDKHLRLYRRYTFVLTSPLSDSRVYSIVYVVQSSAEPLITIEDWKDGLRSRWDGAHGGKQTNDEARATYFFDANWQLVENGGEKCAPIYPTLFRLDEKPLEIVVDASDLVDSTSCARSRDSRVAMTNGAIAKSTFYTVDHRRSVDDIAKRVVFGVR